MFKLDPPEWEEAFAFKLGFPEGKKFRLKFIFASEFVGIKSLSFKRSKLSATPFSSRFTTALESPAKKIIEKKSRKIKKVITLRKFLQKGGKESSMP